jgi:hypothetical protein
MKISINDLWVSKRFNNITHAGIYGQIDIVRCVCDKLWNSSDEFYTNIYQLLLLS